MMRAVAAFGNNNRLIVRNIGNNSACFGFLNNGATRNAYYKRGRFFARATRCATVFAIFGAVFALVAEIGKR